LELCDEQDQIGKGRVQGQLGYLAWERFREAHHAGHPDKVLMEHLNAALQASHEALAILPPDVIDSRATIHHLLGDIYSQALPSRLEQVIAHYSESIRYKEQMGDLRGAARTREHVAIVYAAVGRLDDALLFARAALSNFQHLGQAAAAEITRVQQQIARYEQAARDQ
jgi:hypothetical protein